MQTECSAIMKPKYNRGTEEGKKMFPWRFINLNIIFFSVHSHICFWNLVEYSCFSHFYVDSFGSVSLLFCVRPSVCVCFPLFDIETLDVWFHLAVVLDLHTLPFVRCMGRPSPLSLAIAFGGGQRRATIQTAFMYMCEFTEKLSTFLCWFLCILFPFFVPNVLCIVKYSVFVLVWLVWNRGRCVCCWLSQLHRIFTLF